MTKASLPDPDVPPPSSSAPERETGSGTLKPWYLYLLACADGTTYTGITTDPRRRLREHNAGRGARYTAQERRRPVRLLGVWRFSNQSSATRAELRFKRNYSAARKRQLAAARAAFADAPFCPEYLKDEGETAHESAATVGDKAS